MEYRAKHLPPADSVQAAYDRILEARRAKQPPVVSAPVSMQPTEAELARFRPRPGGLPSVADAEAAARRAEAVRTGRPVAPADEKAPVVNVDKYAPRSGGRPSVAALEEAHAAMVAARGGSTESA